jgi:hypothetical protein
MIRRIVVVAFVAASVPAFAAAQTIAAPTIKAMSADEWEVILPARDLGWLRPAS